VTVILISIVMEASWIVKTVEQVQQNVREMYDRLMIEDNDQLMMIMMTYIDDNNSERR